MLLNPYQLKLSLVLIGISQEHLEHYRVHIFTYYTRIRIILKVFLLKWDEEAVSIGLLIVKLIDLNIIFSFISIYLLDYVLNSFIKFL